MVALPSHCACRDRNAPRLVVRLDRLKDLRRHIGQPSLKQNCRVEVVGQKRSRFAQMIVRALEAARGIRALRSGERA